MSQTIKVFISSTYLDLIEERKAVEKAIQRLNETVPVAMEFFSSNPDTPYDTCMKKVAESNIYVGIFAHRYGSIPLGHNQSMTELEYRKAIELHIPVLIYMTAIPKEKTLFENVEEDKTRNEKLDSLKKNYRESIPHPHFTIPMNCRCW